MAESQMTVDSALQSSLSLSGSWLLGGYNAEYNLSGPLPPHQLCVLADLCINSLLPPEALDAGSIFDLKGRDPPDLIRDDYLSVDRPGGDELLFISGEWFSAENIEEEEEEPVMQAHPFKVRLNTQFEAFSGAHHIIHKAVEMRDGEYPQEVPLNAIACVFPLRTRLFRLGLNLFESRRLPAFFGFAPAVNQTLLIEGNEQAFQLRISAEALRRKEELPLKRSDLLLKLSGIVGQVFGFDLMADYQAGVYRGGSLNVA